MRNLPKIFVPIPLFFQWACAQSPQDLPKSGPWGSGPSVGLRWSLNASAVGAWIAYSSTTLEVPGPVQINGGTTGAAGFYPAMTDDQGDIIQSIVATYAPESSNGSNIECVGNPAFYCLFPYYNNPSGSFTLHGNPNSTIPVVTEGDVVTMEYRMDYDAQFYNQTIWKNGQTVITDQLQTAQNPLRVATPLTEWGPRIECVNNFTGTAPAHRYHDTTIVLNTPAPGFIDSLVVVNASNEKIYTNDGGLTWTIETISLDQVICA